jgi:hypothetical protein
MDAVLSESLPEISPDQVSLGRDAIDAVTALGAAASYMLWALHVCDPPLYLSLGTRLLELSRHEAALDAVIQGLAADATGLDAAVAPLRRFGGDLLFSLFLL